MVAEANKRYHYRMVGRITLRELEQACAELAKQGWELQMQEGAPTIQESLATTLGNMGVSKRAIGVSTQVVVPMRREFTYAEYVALKKDEEGGPGEAG